MHVGTSGWSYDHWEHVLYPPGTPPRDRLAHYVRRFGTVELNSSFYRWPQAGHLRRLAPTTAGRLPPVGEGAPRAHPRQEALRPGGVGGADRRGAGTSSATGARSCSSSSDPATTATTPGWTSSWPGCRRGCARPSSSATPAGSTTASSPCWSATGRVLRHERGGAPVRPARHRAVRLRPAARPGPRAPVRRLVLRRGPALVGRPRPRVGGRRARTSTCTSTTTATATPSATPRRSCSPGGSLSRVRGPVTSSRGTGRWLEPASRPAGTRRHGRRCTPNVVSTSRTSGLAA